jgi:hypothetical protein
MSAFGKDLRYALRQLLKSPGFTIVSLLTFAIGIGANTAVFSLADLIIRKPVALPEMDRLSVVEEQLPASPPDLARAGWRVSTGTSWGCQE